MATKYSNIAHPPIKYSTSLLMKLWLTIYPNYFLHTCTNCLSIINTEKILINLSRICTLSTISPPKSQSLFSQSSNRKRSNNKLKTESKNSILFTSNSYTGTHTNEYPFIEDIIILLPSKRATQAFPSSYPDLAIHAKVGSHKLQQAELLKLNQLP